jgi:hypothetical protein
MDKRTTEIDIAFNRGKNDAKLGRTHNPYESERQFAEYEAWEEGQAHYQDEQDEDARKAA